MTTKIAVVLLAAIMACLSVFAQQPTQPSYAFTPAIADGTVIAGHTFDRNVKYSGFAEINDTGELTFLVQWPAGPGHPSPYKAIYTKSREVIAEGDTFDKITIVELTSLRPGDIQINQAGNVGYFAQFRGRGCPDTQCLAVLINHTVIGTATEGATFLLTDDDSKIARGPGMSAPQPVSTTQSSSWPRGALRVWATQILSQFRILLPGHSIKFPGLGTVVIGGGPITPLPLPGAPNGAPKRESAIAAKPESLPTKPACQAGGAVPFPFPWLDNATAAGPIGSMRSDGPFDGVRYKPVGRAIGGYWQRRIYYSPTCMPILSAMFDNSGRGTLEVNSPAGLVGYLDPAQGNYVFNGVDPVATPSSGVPIESLMRVSRGCQILLPVTWAANFGAAKGLIVGKPVNPGAHCPSE